MIYKRATRALADAGINHIQIVKRLYGGWGAAPEDTRAMKQTSRCFNTWQAARDAVLEGYRPAVEVWGKVVCFYATSPNCFGDVYLCSICNSHFCAHHWGWATNTIVCDLCVRKRMNSV